MVLSGLILFLWGIPIFFIGLLSVGGLAEVKKYTPVDSPVTIIAFAILLTGIFAVVSGFGIWVHKQWARIIGIIIAGLTLASFGYLAYLVNQLPNAVGGGKAWIVTNQQGDTLTVVFPGIEVWLVPVVFWGLIVVALVLGGSYFRRLRIA